MCVSLCVCVGGGCLFCLPLSIAVSCPFLSQLKKGATPLRPWPSVCVCAVFRSLGILGFLLRLCSSLIHSIEHICLRMKSRKKVLRKLYASHKGTQAYTCIYVYLYQKYPHLSTHATVYPLLLFLQTAYTHPYSKETRSH